MRLRGDATPSERLLAAYLDGTGRTWDPEPLLGTQRPDFLVDGQVVCEVTAFMTDHLPQRVGARDPLHPLRLKIKDKYKQAEAARSARHAFVLVLHQAGHEADLSPMTLAAALFGDLAVPMTFDAKRGTMSPGAGVVFGDRGSTEPGNSNLSAAAILRQFNPTLVDLQAAWRQDSSGGSVAEQLATRAAIEHELKLRGVFDPDATATRLIVVHSRTPEVPLPVGWLGGPYDEEWMVDGRSAELTQRHVGPFHARVPQS